jgi:hypothetical protein
VAQALRDLGARPWQVELTAGILATAISEHPEGVDGGEVSTADEDL